MSKKNKKKKSGSVESIPEQTELIGATVDTTDSQLKSFLPSLEEYFGKGIPIVKFFYATLKLGGSIRDYFLAKKLSIFFNGLSDADRAIKEKIEKVLPDENDRLEMAEQLLLYLDRFEQLKKADILLKLFLARLWTLITPNEFNSLTFALDKLDINDLEVFRNFYEDEETFNILNDPSKLAEDDRRFVLRSLTNLKLVEPDYSGNPRSGQLYPRAGGGGEAYYKTNLGEKFISVLNFNLKKEG